MKRLQPTQAIGAYKASWALLANHRTPQPDRGPAHRFDLKKPTIPLLFQALSPAIVAPPRGLVRELKMKGDG